MGKFEDLVIATAKSPAMMFYLDNWLNTDPEAAQRVQQRRGRGAFGGMQQRPGQTPAQKREFGINENYGRELMELHTLGVTPVNGTRLVEVPEIFFTGWTIRQPQQSGDFFYNPQLHVEGAKHVLGHTIDAGGMNDGHGGHPSAHARSAHR